MILLKILFFFITGLIFGSFSNVLVDRSQREEKITGRSHCDFCNYKLKWHDNIPLLSFLFLKGKCRNCKKKLSWQYPIVELSMGLLFLFVGVHAGAITSTLNFAVAINTSFLLFVGFLLLVIFIWDLKYMIIPDGLVIGGVIVTLGYLLFLSLASSCSLLDPNCFVLAGIIGGIIAGGFFWLLYFFSGGKWIGGGDVKLGFLLGMIVGWKFVYLLLLLAYVIGAAVSIVLIIRKRKKLDSKIPFGPFLVASALIVLFFGEKLLQWYWGLL